MKICLAAALVFALFALPAWGDAGGIPHDPHQAEHTVLVGLTNEDGKVGVFDPLSVGSFVETIGEDGQLHFTYDYNSTEGYNIYANDGSGYVVGTIYSLNYDGKPDPQISLNFSCKAGASATTFSFISSIGVIPQFTNVSGLATAGISLTDVSFPANQAYINGLFGGKIYQARYNTSAVFSNLVSSFTTPSGTLTMNENFPSDGVSFSPMTGTLTQMEAEFKFVLKQYDSASGTSNFVAVGTPVPEPSGVLALATGLSGLVGFAIKRRR